ncbi:MAG: flagellar hook assembly protein FlgD [Spirochaetota bacterium]
MDLPLLMNEQQLYKTRMEVENFNKSLADNGRKVSGGLGKDEFLKLLITQLQNQDPTAPMEDREFIAQMAEFSSLEQMTQINNTMDQLIHTNKLKSSYSLLGKYVEVFDEHTGRKESGVVEEITFKNHSPVVSFNGVNYSLDQVTRVSVNSPDDTRR